MSAQVWGSQRCPLPRQCLGQRLIIATMPSQSLNADHHALWSRWCPSADKNGDAIAEVEVGFDLPQRGCLGGHAGAWVSLNQESSFVFLSRGITLGGRMLTSRRKRWKRESLTKLRFWAISAAGR